MQTTLNDDSGSLFLGQTRPKVDDLILISGEGRPRRVTYVMGSAARGWRACFRGQGALPRGRVSWDLLDVPTPPRVRATTAKPVAVSKFVRNLAQRRPLGRVVSSGFDSAWTAANVGAIASILVERERAWLEEPVLCLFSDADSLLAKRGDGAAIHLVPIDQPLIVPNQSGRRPVEKAIAHLVGRRQGGVQPANRSRIEMFGNEAPIWEFLSKFDGMIDPLAAIAADEGEHVIEVFPALAVAGLFPDLCEAGRLPKYNPERATFRLEDWRSLCLAVAELGESHGIERISDWCSLAAKLVQPRKHDQDKLDAIICALIGYVCYFRKANCLMIGDLSSGYVVTPSGEKLERELAKDALQEGVEIKRLW